MDLKTCAEKGLFFITKNVDDSEVKELLFQKFSVWPVGKDKIKVSWEDATQGNALEFKNIAISYWKNQLYPRFQKNALEGKTKYDIMPENVNPFIQSMEQDGFYITKRKDIVTISWDFGIEKLADELRKLSEREGVDRFLPLVNRELTNKHVYMKKMKLTPKQIDILKTENITVEVDGDYVKFSKII